MQDKRETSDNQKPTPYQRGKMFYRQGMTHNPYLPGTPGHTEFYRGMLDAEEEDKLAAEISSWHEAVKEDWQYTMQRVRDGDFNPSL